MKPAKVAVPIVAGAALVGYLALSSRDSAEQSPPPPTPITDYYDRNATGDPAPTAPSSPLTSAEPTASTASPAVADGSAPVTSSSLATTSDQTSDKTPRAPTREVTADEFEQYINLLRERFAVETLNKVLAAEEALAAAEKHRDDLREKEKEAQEKYQQAQDNAAKRSQSLSEQAVLFEEEARWRMNAQAVTPGSLSSYEALNTQLMELLKKRGSFQGSQEESEKLDQRIYDLRNDIYPLVGHKDKVAKDRQRLKGQRRAEMEALYAKFEKEESAMRAKAEQIHQSIAALYPQWPDTPTVQFAFPEFLFLDPGQDDHVLLDHTSDLKLQLQVVSDPKLVSELEGKSAQVELHLQGAAVVKWQMRPFEEVAVARAGAEQEKPAYQQGRLTIPPGAYHLGVSMPGAGKDALTARRAVVYAGEYDLPVPTSVHGEKWPTLTKLKEQIKFDLQRRNNMRQLAGKYWVLTQSGPKAGEAADTPRWICTIEDAFNAWSENERVAEQRNAAARQMADKYFCIIAGHYDKIASDERAKIQEDVLRRVLLLRQARTESFRRQWALARGLPLLYPILPYEKDDVSAWAGRMQARGNHYRAGFREKQWAEEELALAQRVLKWVNTARALKLQTGRIGELEDKMATLPTEQHSSILAQLVDERRALVLARADASISAVMAAEVMREKLLDQQKLPYLNLKKQWDTLARTWRDEHSGKFAQFSNVVIALANSGFAMVDFVVALGFDTSQQASNQLFGTQFKRQAQQIDEKIVALYERNSRAIAYLLDLHNMTSQQISAANDLAINHSRQLTAEQIRELSELIGKDYRVATHMELLRDHDFFYRTGGGVLRMLGGICATGLEKRRQEYAIGLAGAKLTLFHVQHNFFAAQGREPTGKFKWSTWMSPAKYLSEGLGEYMEFVKPGGRAERRADITNKAYQVRHFEELRRRFEYIGYDLSRLSDPRLANARQLHYELLASNPDYREFYRRLRQLDYAAMAWHAKRRLSEELDKEEPSDAVLGAELFTLRTAPMRSLSEDLTQQKAILWLRLRDSLVACDWPVAINTTKKMERLGMGNLGPARALINDQITRDLGCQVLQNWGDAAIYQALTAKIGSFFKSKAALRVDLQKRLVLRRGATASLLVGRTFTFGGLGSYWWSVACPFSQGVRAAALSSVESIAQKYLEDELIVQFQAYGHKLDPAVAAKMAQASIDLAKGIMGRVQQAGKDALNQVPEDAAEFKTYLEENAADMKDHPIMQAAERLAEAAEAVQNARGGDADTVARAESEFALCMGDMRDLLTVADGGRKCALLETQILRHVLGGAAAAPDVDPPKLLAQIDEINKTQFANVIADHQMTRHRDLVRAAVVEYLGVVGDVEGQTPQTIEAAVRLLQKVKLDRLCQLKDSGMLTYTDEKAVDRARRTVVHHVRDEITRQFAGDLVAVVITGTGGDTANPEYKRVGSDQDFTLLVREGVEPNKLKKAFDQRFRELTGREPADFSIECFQDPITKLAGLSSESMSRTFARLRAEAGQGERYLVFGNLKFFRFIDQRVGRGFHIRNGKLLQMSDAEFEGLFGGNKFNQGDGFDILVDNCAFVSHYEHAYAGKPLEMLSHIAKYDIRILAGVMASSPDGVELLNGLSREAIAEAGFHAAVVRKAQQTPSLKAALADDPNVRAYYDTLALLKQGKSVAEAMGLKRKPNQTAAEYTQQLEARATEMLTLGSRLRKQHIAMATEARLEYRKKMVDRIEQLDSVLMDPAAPASQKAEAQAEFDRLGQELKNRDFAAGFQLRKLSAAQADAIAGSGGSGAHAADTLLKLRDLLASMDQVPEMPEPVAAGRESCPVF